MSIGLFFWLRFKSVTLDGLNINPISLLDLIIKILQNIPDGLWVVLGVLIGSALSPLTDAALHKRAERRRLMAEIPSLIHLYFQIEKEHYRVRNASKYEDIKTLRIAGELLRTDISSEGRDKLNEAIENANKELDKLNAEHQNTFEKLVDIESKLVAARARVNSYAKKNQRMDISRILNKVIYEGSLSEYVLDFEQEFPSIYDFANVEKRRRYSQAVDDKLRDFDNMGREYAISVEQTF